MTELDMSVCTEAAEVLEKLLPDVDPEYARRFRLMHAFLINAPRPFLIDRLNEKGRRAALLTLSIQAHLFSQFSGDRELVSRNPLPEEYNQRELEGLLSSRGVRSALCVADVSRQCRAIAEKFRRSVEILKEEI